MQPAVLAVIPTLDAGSHRLARLLDALEDLTGGPRIRTMVIVNRGAGLPLQRDGSSPPSGRDQVEFIEAGLNLGFAGSIELASALVPSVHLWLLQDDLLPDPDCLAVLADALECDPALGAVSPTRIEGGLVPRGSAGGLLDASGRVAAFLPRRSVPTARYAPEPAPDFVMSRGLLVRSAAWRAVGGMDARFYPVGWSDVDLCLRLREAGWRIASVAGAIVHHEKGASTPAVLGHATSERNGALFRAKLAGVGARPPVHPDIPREVLEAVAQSAASLALDLVGRMRPRDLLLLAVRRAIRRLLSAVGRG